MASSLVAYKCYLPLWLCLFPAPSEQPSSANMPYQQPVQDAKAPCVASCGKKETKTSRVRQPVRRETHLFNSLLWPEIDSLRANVTP